MARFSSDMNDTVCLQRIRENKQSGEESGVRSTPTFFINGRLLDVSFGISSLFDVVEKTLRK
jgi:protein-disulfide isomerase